MLKDYSGINVLWKMQEIILIICLGVMGLAIFLQVLTRQLFQTPLTWSEELARYLQVWITFLGIGYGLRHKSHIKVEIFINKISKKGQRIIKIFVNVILIFCLLQIIPGTYRFMINQNLIGSSAMGIRMSIVYLVLPISIIDMLFIFVFDIIANIKDLTLKNSNQKREAV